MGDVFQNILRKTAKAALSRMARRIRDLEPRPGRED